MCVLRQPPPKPFRPFRPFRARRVMGAATVQAPLPRQPPVGWTLSLATCLSQGHMLRKRPARIVAMFNSKNRNT